MTLPVKQEKPPCRQQGFTLIEVLVVIAIFSIGILGAMSMQISAVTTNASTRKSTLAVEYATDTMERLMQINPSNADKFNVDDNGTNGIDDANEADTDLNGDNLDNDGDGAVDNEVVWHGLPEFTAGGGHVRGVTIPENAYYDSFCDLSWTVTDIDCDNDGVNDAKRVDITVTWDGGDKNFQLSNIRTSIL